MVEYVVVFLTIYPSIHPSINHTESMACHFFCEQLLPRLKLEGSGTGEISPGVLTCRASAFTDEKFFRLEQDDRQQRVWLDSVTTKKISNPRVETSTGVLRTYGRVFFFLRNWPLLLRTLFWRCHVATSQGTSAVGLQTGLHRAISAHAKRHGPSGSLWEGNATALRAVLYRRFVQDRQRHSLSHYGGQLARQRCRSFQRQLCGKKTTHQATAVRPRGTKRMLLARRSVHSKIAFSRVSMPTEAISRHDVFTVVAFLVPSQKKHKKNSNHLKQRSTLAASSFLIKFKFKTPDVAYTVRQLVPADRATRLKKGNGIGVLTLTTCFSQLS